ncbi:UPF0488 protein C8orf33 homolog [Rhineura floridana]|uniref:UPF0488 protein C8orf33 homolog n=1 Tax=Rhineura floridana TaxID=261503 RepID=UPI002AC85799|nr:UPF0488 protein C8orf33 homolog [Rhineura floridana]XP_061456207.1 UPF0488 protein C8orf33 homolog [Rhineura floridana]XP_061456208.1 UPF0488 protein C8orf33 homolog [Rhineura floridana]
MEEAPKPTYQDELEWCISQLETGLLRLNPTPKEAEETQCILGVLRSRKAPLLKKRQVMHRVFGDYQLKMAEERQKAAKAAMKSENTMQIQPGDALSSGSVVYQKQSSRSSAAPTSWFAPSDNSFQFDFVLSERTSEEMDGTVGEACAVDDSREWSPGNGPLGTLDFSTGTKKPEFAFNFVIPDVLPLPSVAADLGSEAAIEATTEVDPTSQNAMVTMPENAAFPKPDKSDAMGSTSKRDGEDPVREVSKSEAAQVAIMETKETKLTVTAGGSSKRKKKKKPPPSKVAHSDNVNGDSKLHGKGTSNQAEMCQSDDQMKREVDWCVEQLELGLKTRKSTPKQMDEALRAIKTLRSEKAVLAKKRQLMRALFGDYRTKIAEERQKQLKLMQAASKAARIAEVADDASRKSSRVFRKSAVMTRTNQRPAESFPPPPTPATSTGATETCSFVLTPSQEEFRFNFF